MLSSELAVDIGIDPSVMSKRLGTYFQEAGRERERYLSPQTVADVRQAHQLLNVGQARSFKTAVQMALGTHTEALPPESAREILQRLDNLERSQDVILRHVERLLTYIEQAFEQPARDLEAAVQGQPEI